MYTVPQVYDIGPSIDYLFRWTHDLKVISFF